MWTHRDVSFAIYSPYILAVMILCDKWFALLGAAQHSSIVLYYIIYSNNLNIWKRCQYRWEIRFVPDNLHCLSVHIYNDTFNRENVRFSISIVGGVGRGGGSHVFTRVKMWKYWNGKHYTCHRQLWRIYQAKNQIVICLEGGSEPYL